MTSYKEYVDPAVNFKVSYPDGWVSSITAGSRAIFYSSNEIADGFATFEPKGNHGAKIEVMAKAGDAALVETMITELKEVFTDPNAVKAPEQTTVNGLPATKVTYTAPLGESGSITAERYFIVTDGMVTYLETAVIGTYDDYKAIFETVRKGFQPARIATATPAEGDTTGTATPAVTRDSIVTDPPSTEMKSYSGSGFSMNYPSNFDATTSGGGTIFTGARADSRVQVNSQDAKDVPLDQIVEASKKNYGGRAGAKTTVGGKPAYVFSYGSGGASARAYYTMAGNRLYVISTSWFTPQSDLYQPAFEKMLASFRAK
ncbi:MAG: hypothetical protein H7X80_03390 [bacterium]|nr:hypothetical protein [Candidatus Kapabacteria bacterium]